MADGHDNTGGFLTRRERRLIAKASFTNKEVDEVDPAGGNPNQHFSMLRLRDCQIPHLHHLRAACLRNLNCLHHSYLCTFCFRSEGVEEVYSN